MKFLSNLAIIALISGSGLFSLSAQAACGKVVISDMNWQSATFMAYADKAILEGMGCEVEIFVGETTPTIIGMSEKGTPNAAPELWVNVVKEVLDKAVAENRIVYAGLSLLDGGEEGFWVPKYMVDKHPELATMEGVLSRPDLFPDPEDKSRGLVQGCPSGWTCQITTGNLYKAFGMDAAGFNFGDAGSAAGLDGSLAKAYERGQGWFGYYWEPSSLMGKYDMVKVDFGVPHNAAEWASCIADDGCADPQPNAWSPSVVYTVTTAGLKEESPEAYAYFAKRGFKNKFMNNFLKWMGENQATGEEAADYFLKTYPEVWTAWVDSDTAKNVKAAL